jgi:hypothetical protein
VDLMMKTMINNSASRLNSFVFVLLAAVPTENNLFNSFRISTNTFAFTIVTSVIAILFLFGNLKRIKTVNSEYRQADKREIHH